MKSKIPTVDLPSGSESALNAIEEKISERNEAAWAAFVDQIVAKRKMFDRSAWPAHSRIKSTVRENPASHNPITSLQFFTENRSGFRYCGGGR